MQIPQLFCTLPEDLCSTPDGMAVYKDGDLILSAANYADDNMAGCILKIDRDRNVKKWVDVPVHPETGIARPMGIAFGPDWDLYVVDNQGWTGRADLVFKGRILRLHIVDDKLASYKVIASGMEHPNGMRIKDGYVYVTQSTLSKVQDPSGRLVSCVYRFALDDENIVCTNTLADKHILTTFITHNPKCQYGVDGIEFDLNGDLLVGNFGDGAVHRIRFKADGSVRDNTVWTKDPANLKSTDGFILDPETGNLYIADFSANAIGMVKPDGSVHRIAQSPDTDGLHGELDQPGEPCIWNGMLVVSCFDLVCDGDKVNTAHEMPATMSTLELEK